MLAPRPGPLPLPLRSSILGSLGFTHRTMLPRVRGICDASEIPSLHSHLGLT